MSKRKFCLSNNLEMQSFDTFVKEGLICVKKVQKAKAIRYQVDPSEFQKLSEGVHYITCPECEKKMITADTHFAKLHPNARPPSNLSGSWHIERRRKSEEAKRRQSECLLKRFQTAAGEITREQIRRAAKKSASLPRVKAAKSRAMKELWQCPDKRKKFTESIRRAAQAPDARKKKSLIALHNPKVREVLRKGRQLNNRTSKMHLRFKQKMVHAGLQGFVTEYTVGPYQIDEGNPDLKVAVEIDGCFWHGCSVCGFEPFGDNARIDKAKNTFLRRRGWSVLRIPGHIIRSEPNKAIQLIQTEIPTHDSI